MNTIFWIIVIVCFLIFTICFLTKISINKKIFLLLINVVILLIGLFLEYNFQEEEMEILILAVFVIAIFMVWQIIEYAYYRWERGTFIVNQTICLLMMLLFFWFFCDNIFQINQKRVYTSQRSERIFIDRHPDMAGRYN